MDVSEVSCDRGESGVQPYIVAVDRNEAERRVRGWDQAEHGEKPIDERDAFSVDDGTVNGSGRDQPPYSEGEVHEVMQDVDGE